MKRKLVTCLGTVVLALSACGGGGPEVSASAAAEFAEANVLALAKPLSFDELPPAEKDALKLHLAIAGVAPVANIYGSLVNEVASKGSSSVAATLMQHHQSLSDAEAARKVLGNLAITPTSISAAGSYSALLDAVTLLFGAYGPGARGQITLNLSTLLLGLTKDPTFGLAATQYLERLNGAASSAPAAKVMSVSATSVKFGDTVTVTGENLNLVRSLSIGGVSLTPVAGASNTLLTFRAPKQRISGMVTLITAAQKESTSTQAITVFEPIQVSALAKPTSFAGKGLSVSGVAMDTVTGIKVAGMVGEITAKSNNSLTFSLPGNLKAGEYPIEFSSPHEKLNGPSVIIQQGVTVNSFGAVTGAGVTYFKVEGAAMKAVSGAKVGAARATNLSAQDGAVSFQVPAGTVGSIVLETSTEQGEVPVGQFASKDATEIKMDRLEFAQTYSFPDGDPKLKLTLNKLTGLRIGLSSTAQGMNVTSVTVKANSADGTVLGTVNLAGPATLPQSVSMYEYDKFFKGTAPSAMMVDGSTWTVTAVVGGVTLTQTAKPKFAAPIAMKLVLVPIQLGSGGAVGVPSPTEEIVNHLAQVFPYSREQLDVKVHATPLVVSGASEFDTREGWSNVLSQIETRRRAEDPKAYYYGVVPPMPRAQTGTAITVGMAYLGNVSSASVASTSGLGIDSRWTLTGKGLILGRTLPQHLDTMVHEIGHIHSLQHAPCGLSEADRDYPYTDAQLGSTVMHVFDYFATGIPSFYKTPSIETRDTMSYCAGEVFSDYNYAKTHSFAEARTAHTKKANLSSLSNGEGVASGPAKLISGTISPAGLSLNRYTDLPRRGLFPAATRSEWELLVTYEDGAVNRYLVPVSALSVHEEGYFGFHLEVPSDKPIRSVKMTRNGVAVPLRI